MRLCKGICFLVDTLTTGICFYGQKSIYRTIHYQKALCYGVKHTCSAKDQVFFDTCTVINVQKLRKYSTHIWFSILADKIRNSLCLWNEKSGSALFDLRFWYKHTIFFSVSETYDFFFGVETFRRTIWSSVSLSHWKTQVSSATVCFRNSGSSSQKSCWNVWKHLFFHLLLKQKTLPKRPLAQPKKKKKHELSIAVSCCTKHQLPYLSDFMLTYIPHNSYFMLSF
jgi:hypothetical protein